MVATTLDLRRLNRALLERQLLCRPSDLTVEQAVEHLIGLQSQNPAAPYFALWSRLRKFEPADLSALMIDRKLVRIALMRSTVYLVTADDCLRLRSLLQPVMTKNFTAGSRFGKALAGIDRKSLAAQAQVLLAERPMTTGEASRLLVKDFPVTDLESMAASIRADLALVQIPPRGVWGAGGRPVCTTAEAWLGRPLETAPSLRAMVLRYLAAYGPAGVADIQAWSGLTRLAEVVEDLGDGLAKFISPGGMALYDVPDAARPSGDLPVPTRLLAEFDTVLLSHLDRSRVIDEPTRRRVFTENGIIRGGVLIDGFVKGAWKYRSGAKAASIVIEPMAQFSGTDRDEIERQALSALDFAAPSVPHQVVWE